MVHFFDPIATNNRARAHTKQTKPNRNKRAHNRLTPTKMAIKLLQLLLLLLLSSSSMRVLAIYFCFHFNCLAFLCVQVSYAVSRCQTEFFPRAAFVQLGFFRFQHRLFRAAMDRTQRHCSLESYTYFSFRFAEKSLGNNYGWLLRRWCALGNCSEQSKWTQTHKTDLDILQFTRYAYEPRDIVANWTKQMRYYCRKCSFAVLTVGTN